MAALGKAADEPPRMAVNVVLEVRQRLLTPLASGLGLEQENGQGAEQGEIARGGGVVPSATVLVLSAIAAIVLPIFDAPVVAGQFQQALRAGLLGPISGHGQADVVGLFGHPALAHVLGVAADAHDLSHPR
jgi:hypothetical protein